VIQVRSRTLCLFTLLATGTAACGDDSSLGGDGDPDTADAAPQGDGAPAHDCQPGLPFDDPSDFAREDCVPGSLAGLDPTGIWHLDVQGDLAYSFIQVLRFDPAGDGFVAVLNGGTTPEVHLTDDDLFARQYYSSSEFYYATAYDACALDDEGRLRGRWAVCFDTECDTGTFTAVRVEPIPGEPVADGLELVSEWRGAPGATWESIFGGRAPALNVRVADGVAYVVTGEDGLRIVDVSDPAAPADLGASPTARVDQFEFYNDVKIVDGPSERRHAIVASDARGAVSIDVTDPTNPQEVATFPPPTFGTSGVGVHTLFTETTEAGTRAYLATRRRRASTCST
jgi:hypothetical protein